MLPPKQNNLVRYILDISKIETGKETLSESDYRINEVVTNVINVAKQKIGSKPVKLLINIDQSTSSVLHGDSSKLYQSLLNKGYDSSLINEYLNKI